MLLRARRTIYGQSCCQVGRLSCSRSPAPSGGLDAAQVAVYDLRSHKSKTLFRGGSAARYVAAPFAKPGAPGGYLVFVAKGGLRSIGFDLSRLETQGTVITLAEQVVTDFMGDGDFAVAHNGTLLYGDAPGSRATLPRELVWVDRAAREKPAGPPPNSYLSVSISPVDESRFALTVLEEDQAKIWIWDGEGFTKLRFKLEESRVRPCGLPMATRSFFKAARPTVGPACGGWPQMVPVIPSAWRSAPTPSWRPAWRMRVISYFTRRSGNTNLDILQLALGGNREITPLIQTSAFETNGMVSPNRHWLAFQCCTESQPDIYISPYPKTLMVNGQCRTRAAEWPSGPLHLKNCFLSPLMAR
jgi:hypothetical protein